MDTDDDEIYNGFEIPDILTDAGVTQMEMAMMNEGLKDRVVDVAMVESEYMERIQDLLPSQDGLNSSSEVEQQAEAVLPVGSVLRHRREGGLPDQ